MTTMLYNDPHPIHRRMGDEIGCSYIEAEKGGVLDRIKRAAFSSYSGTVLLEGGAPLVQGAALRAMGHADRVVMLAADETLLNQEERLPYYTAAETYAHAASMRFVDGVIGVSPRISQIARDRFDVPAVTSRPFVLDEMADRLVSNEPDLDGERILCVAENRPAFDQETLAAAAGDRETLFVGRGTEDLPGGRGYVPLEELIGLYRSADLFVMPARAGAYPMAPVEAMTASVPAIITEGAGSSEVARQVDDRLVCECAYESMRAAIDDYFDKDPEERRLIGRACAEETSHLNEHDGAMNFAESYDRLMEMV